MNEHKKINLDKNTQININLEDGEDVQVIHIGGDGDEDYGMWGLGVTGVLALVLSGTGGMGLFEDAGEIISTIVSFAGIVVAVPCAVLMVLRLKKRKDLNKIASLVVSSQLRNLADIARFTGMPEKKLIDYLHLLFSDSSGHQLGNDARYLKGGKLDLQTMEIKLSDKYIEKEPWTCVYCRASNEKDVLTCSSCQAPKKKV